MGQGASEGCSSVIITEGPQNSNTLRALEGNLALDARLIHGADLIVEDEINAGEL